MGVLAFAWLDDLAQSPGTPPLLPILVGIAVLTGVLCAWEGLDARERAYSGHMIQSESASGRSIRSGLEAGLDAQIRVLQRMVEALGENWPTYAGELAS